MLHFAYITQKILLNATFVALFAGGLLSAQNALAAPSMTPSTLPDGRVGVTYNQYVGFTSTVDTPMSWSLIDLLPPGVLRLEVDNGARLQLKGTATTAGTYAFRLIASNAYGYYRDASYSIVIRPMEIGDASLPNGRVGVAYARTLSVVGGTAPYSWTIDRGQLPVGMTLNSAAGTITGTPSFNLTYLFTLRVTDAVGRTATKELTITVDPASPPIAAPTITTTSLPDGMEGTWYGFNLGATGGVAPYRWNLASGNLPPGFTFAELGSLYGNTIAGTYTFHLEVFDARGLFSGRTFTLTVRPSSSGDPGLLDRLNNFARIGVSVHTLVKLPDDGNRFTQEDSAVYYLGADGRRHAFTNDKVYFSWYSGFSGVRIVNAPDLASIPLGANVTYKPGVKMVKFLTDPRVYAVAGGRTLRWVSSEAAARELYGLTWNRQIDDIADTFYPDYTISLTDPIVGLSNFNPTTVRNSYNFISDVLPL